MPFDQAITYCNNLNAWVYRPFNASENTDVHSENKILKFIIERKCLRTDWVKAQSVTMAWIGMRDHLEANEWWWLDGAPVNLTLLDLFDPGELFSTSRIHSFSQDNRMNTKAKTRTAW